MKRFRHMQLIYARFLKKECSIDELNTLFQHFETSSEEELRSIIEKVLLNEENHLELDSTRQDKLDGIQLSIENKLFTPKYARINWRLVVSAAAVVLLLSTVTIFYLYRNTIGGDRNITATIQDVPPGTNAATLTLSDGRKIDLANVTQNQIAKDAGISINKTKDGQLVYKIESNSKNMSATNTLRTNRGQTYQVVLPDNSKVWLNSSSSITYSTAIGTDAIRNIELHGEAYFEVAKDKNRPFIVNISGQQIKVLGTEFNVKGYIEKPKVETTLVEGCVEVKNRAVIKRLLPGEQAISDIQIVIRKANLSRTLDWKNGLFYLDDESLESIMLKIAEWYNVEVIYQGKTKSVRFGGEISRNKKLSEILKVLESESTAFKLEERRLTVIYK